MVEIMIVVAVLGLLVAIMSPNFTRAKRAAWNRNCQNNLRLIKHALEQYQLDDNLANGTDISGVYSTVITGASDAYIENAPLCPCHEVAYTVSDVEVDPTCTSRDGDPTNPVYISHLLL